MIKSILSFFSKNEEVPKVQKFGTITGVFIPTTLTILGVIMYLRQGWVVGNAGVLGALAILGIAISITVCTGLALSSITTNIRIGAGGAFSIISQSLGIEMGGSIGIPFYISQALAVAMYIFGFREGIQWIYPELPSLLIDLGAFAAIYGIASISTNFAFRVQSLILIIIALSLLSIYGGLFIHDLNFDFELFGKYPGSPENNFSGTSFWVVFAVFFPAVTGIMTGANVSGDLKDPRRSLPAGTMSAIFVTALIYLSLVFVVALLATPEELVSNYTILIDKSFFRPIVIAGLLGATLSSALGSIIGAPRILFVLGEKKLFPKSKFLSKKTEFGEPRNALFVTAIIVLFGLMAGNLNAIAPFITMFFMITYCMINLVVLIEQSLGLPSFRPKLHIPIIIPIIGTIGCLAVMFVINPIIAMIALGLIVSFYIFLVSRKIKHESGDSRSGLFTALAEWATKKSNALSPTKEPRAWQPDLLIPVASVTEIRSSYKLIHSLVYPKGSIKMIGLPLTRNADRIRNYINLLKKSFSETEIYTTSSLVKGPKYADTISISMQALAAAFFKPNTLLLTVEESTKFDTEYEKTIKKAEEYEFGALIYVPYGKVGLGLEKRINVWVTGVDEKWKDTMDLANNDLSILTGILIQKNWKGGMHMILCGGDEDEELTPFNPRNVQKLYDYARLPQNTNHMIIKKPLDEGFEDGPESDLNIIPLPEKASIEDLRNISAKLQTSCLFTLDSGSENALV